jgi:hypothetical protein
MVKPQQPELRRSDRGATSDDALKEQLTAPSVPGVDAGVGRVPEANLPGHHPEHEQDKPSGQDFVAKMHALAQEDEYEPPTTDDEVVDLRQVAPESRSGTLPSVVPDRVEKVAALAGRSVETSVKVAAKVTGTMFGLSTRMLRSTLPRRGSN